MPHPLIKSQSVKSPTAQIALIEFAPVCPTEASCDVHAERIGYQAASLLGQVMSGEKKFDESILFEAADVVTRQSIDIIACDDPEIGKCCDLSGKMPAIILRTTTSNGRCNFLGHNWIGVSRNIRGIPPSKKISECNWKRQTFIDKFS